jgi:hypothetical protein
MNYLARVVLLGADYTCDFVCDFMCDWHANHRCDLVLAEIAPAICLLIAREIAHVISPLRERREKCVKT